jgi:alcohol dehydrogenase class IV
MNRTVWTFTGPGTLVFGRGSTSNLSEIARRHQFTRFSIVSDRQLGDAGVVDQVIAPLREAGCAIDVFEGGEPDAPVPAVEAAVNQIRAFQPHAILGLGGGSNMDLAKAAACVVAHGGSPRDYAGDQLIPGPIFPLILLPTTAGTGSEVTAAAVLHDIERGTKFGILSNHLRPLFAIVDPLLTASCPPSVTADSGIDALTHAVEAYLAVDNESFPLPPGEATVYQGHTPFTDIFAERAISLIGAYLQRAVHDGADREAREKMSLAATTAGYAFSNSGVATVHALEYALGPVAKIPHGRGCGMLLPYVMQFNAPVHGQRMRRIGELLGVDVAGQSDGDACESVIATVRQLRKSIGIPDRLSEVGVSAEHLESMAEQAAGVKRILRVSPRAVAAPDLRSILETAL